MKPEKAEYVSKRLAHARRTLEEVEIRIDNELWNIAVNRLYYACFYAVTALLHNYGWDTKTHGGAHRMFNLHFIKSGIINKEYNDLYSTLMDMRQDADYEDDVEYERDDVLNLLQLVKELIAAIEAVLAKEDIS